MRNRRTATAAILAVVIPFTVAACSGSGESADGATSTTAAPAGASGAAPPPQIPFALGTRVALGDWELAVDAATVAATTTVTARLQNTTTKSVGAPPSTVFALKDGATTSPIAAQVTGLPARMAPGVDARITITFESASAPTDPYLHWTGTTRDAIQADVKLTPGEPTAPLG